MLLRKRDPILISIMMTTTYRQIAAVVVFIAYKRKNNASSSARYDEKSLAENNSQQIYISFVRSIAEATLNCRTATNSPMFVIIIIHH